MDVDSVLGLPKRAVVAEIQGESARVGYTISLASYLETLYNNRAGQKGVRLEVWSSGLDLETLKLHCEYFKGHYDDLGYDVDWGARSCIEYRVRMVPGAEFKTMDVELVTARGKGEKLVGRFENKAEAQQFIDTFYAEDSNPFKFPVCALNSATKEFLIKRQTKMLEIR